MHPADERRFVQTNEPAPSALAWEMDVTPGDEPDEPIPYSVDLTASLCSTRSTGSVP